MIDNSIEKNVEKALVKFLTEEGFYFERIRTTGIYSEEGVMPDITGKGRADYFGCYKGIFFAFETKSAKGLIKKIQELKKLQVLAAGGRHYYIRSESDIQRVRNDLKYL